MLSGDGGHLRGGGRKRYVLVGILSGKNVADLNLAARSEARGVGEAVSVRFVSAGDACVHSGGDLG